MTEDEARRRVIRSMCPEKVCRTCGEPSRRIVGPPEYFDSRTGEHLPEFAGRFQSRAENGRTAVEKTGGSVPRKRVAGYGTANSQFPTLGWSDCGHDDWRPGVCQDPFAESGRENKP